MKGQEGIRVLASTLIALSKDSSERSQYSWCKAYLGRLFLACTLGEIFAWYIIEASQMQVVDVLGSPLGAGYPETRLIHIVIFEGFDGL